MSRVTEASTSAGSNLRPRSRTAAEHDHAEPKARHDLQPRPPRAPRHLPAGCARARRRHDLRPLGSAGDPRRAGAGRRPQEPDQPRPAARGGRRLVHPRPRRRRRAALRLPGARPVGPDRGHALQPRQAAARPLRPRGDRGRRLLGADPRPRAGVGLRARPDRLLRRGPAQRRRGRLPAAGPGRPAGAAGGVGGLRAARQGVHPAAPGRPRAPPRQLRGARLPRGRAAPGRPGRHRRRAAARAPVRVRALPDPPRAEQLLGLQHPRLLRPARGVRLGGHARPAGARVQGHGLGAARRRHRGHPGRGLQPHRRGRPRGPDAGVPGAGPPRLLPADRRPAQRLRRDRLRELRGHLRARRAAAGARLAALLGHGDGRRRLPLRPRHHPAPRRAAPRRPAPRLQGGTARATRC